MPSHVAARFSHNNPDSSCVRSDAGLLTRCTGLARSATRACARRYLGHVAGTIIYQVEPLHTYQRRLEPEELRGALEGTHLYVVSRRRRTTVHLQQRSGQTRLMTRTHDGPQGTPIRHVTDSIDEAEVLYDGAYWRGRCQNTSVHGEAWHLAALLSDRDTEVCRHEVLYVGQSFGRDGSRHVGDRVRAHATIQKIYEDNQASDWDVFVTPLLVERSDTISDDHIYDDDSGPRSWGKAAADGGWPVSHKATVSTLEHLLISYFRPRYNQVMLKWCNAKHFGPIRADGYRLLMVQLQTLHALSAFFTQWRPAARTHAIVAEVPASLNATTFEIGTWDDVTLHPGSLMHPAVAGARWIAEMSDRAPGLLRLFGDHGPQFNPDFSAWL